MKKFTSLTLSSALIALLSAPLTVALAQSTAKALPDGVAATVNGKPVSELAVTNVMTQISNQGEQPDRNQIISELINLEVLTQAAEELGLDKKPAVAAALHLQYTQSMSNAYLSEVGQGLEVTDSELRAEYDKQAAGVTADEYNASHILLDSESDATDVINELANGGDFAALAKARSTGPTGENGGNLGWFQADSMVAEFSTALASMKPGDTSAAPVQTQFGWHVIKLNDTRSAPTPDFESVKDGIRNIVVRNRLAKIMDDLIEKAEVTR
jgi:peptidyl-prolyl cis-trans isomerase C